MAPKKITVIDAYGKENKIVVANDSEFKSMVDNYNVCCLETDDSIKWKIYSFESLVNGDTYAVGPSVKRKKQKQDSEEEEHRTARSDEAIEYIFKQKQDSQTLFISKPETRTFGAAMNRIGVRKDAPVWNNKPTNLPSAPPRFKWLASKEDSPENRAAYMAYLRNNKNLVLPPDTIIFDGNADGELLNVQMEGFRVKTSGSIDVPLANSRHQSLAIVKENMLGAFELKKDTNEAHANIERQVTLQHMAASYLNPNTGLLTVMTDLHDRWHFFWFTKDKRLMRYESTESEARFLIKHMLDGSETVSTPTGFLSRASWNDLFLVSITKSPEAVVPNDSHSNGAKDDDNDYDKEERSISNKAGGLSLSKNKKQGVTRNDGGKRCAALDEEEAQLSSSPLDFMDKEEELEAVLHMAMHTSFHRMLGPPKAEAGHFPPSQIDC